MLARIPIG